MDRLLFDCGTIYFVIMVSFTAHTACEGSIDLCRNISDNLLLQTLRDEKSTRMPGGLYHELQVRMTYNSNHIEGSRLSEDQTRMIFETNTVGGHKTAAPKEVSGRMKALLSEYEAKTAATIDDIVCFHYEFERIHPFQDGNGRVGRLIALKECLRFGFVPFIIEDAKKFYYYRGLAEWEREKGYLIDTCLEGQDTFRNLMSLFDIRP